MDMKKETEQKQFPCLKKGRKLVIKNKELLRTVNT